MKSIIYRNPPDIQSKIRFYEILLYTYGSLWGWINGCWTYFKEKLGKKPFSNQEKESIICESLVNI